MTRMIELTDLYADGREPVTVPVGHVARTIRDWYPASDDDARPSELEMIGELQEALLEWDYDTARDIAAEIAVGFDEVAERP